MIIRGHALAGPAVTASVFIAPNSGPADRAGRSLSLPGDYRQTRCGSGVT